MEDIRPYFEQSKDFGDTYETLEKAHGQIELRQYEVITDTGWLRQAHSEWGHIQSIGRSRIQITKNGQASEDIRYFILGCQVSAKNSVTT